MYTLRHEKKRIWTEFCGQKFKVGTEISQKEKETILIHFHLTSEHFIS